LEYFSLIHTETNPAFGEDAGEDNPFSWTIKDSAVEGWLSGKLGPDIVHEIDLAVGNNSALKEFIFKHPRCAYLDTKVGRRPAVDLVLLTATSIINGTSAVYQRTVAGQPAEGAGGESCEKQGN